jgi:hypothetical protein
LSLPDDWIFEVEAMILRLIPAYTLETLDQCEIDRLFHYYFWDYRQSLKNKKASGGKTDSQIEPESNIVYRDGKPYKRINAKNSDENWAKNIF